jgi:hypothetical protein
MKSRLVLFTACLLIASHALAQTPPPAPRAPKPPPAPTAAPATPPAAPAPPVAAAPAAPPLPPPPPAPPRGGQSINVKVELTISESGAAAPPVKKTVVAVVGDGFSGYVREQATSAFTTVTPGTNIVDRIVAPLNLDARPEILANGKIRLTCTIQYVARGPGQDERRMQTDIKQSLILNLESGKALVVSDATDPITDRRVTVEVTATILR